jgi:hypothetical protein
MCEIMRAVFLGEGSRHCDDLLVMGAHCDSINNDYGVKTDGSSALHTDTGVVSDWIEMWDYVGGIRFRGFVAQKAMFVFFDQEVVGGDLKAGYVLTHRFTHAFYVANAYQTHGPPRTLRSRLLLLRPPRRLHRPPSRGNGPRYGGQGSGLDWLLADYAG